MHNIKEYVYYTFNIIIVYIYLILCVYLTNTFLFLEHKIVKAGISFVSIAPFVQKAVSNK